MLSPQSPLVLPFTTSAQHYLGAWKRLKKTKNNLCSTLNYFMSYFNFSKQIHLGIFVFVELRFMIIIKTRRLVCVIKWWRIIQFQAKLLMVSLPSRHVHVVLLSVLGLVTSFFIPLMSSFITSHLDIIKLGRHLGHSEYKSCHSWIYELV